MFIFREVIIKIACVVYYIDARQYINGKLAANCPHRNVTSEFKIMRWNEHFIGESCAANIKCMLNVAGLNYLTYSNSKTY